MAAKQIKAKSDWNSPVQKDLALKTVWQRLTYERIDLQAFREEPKITYYNKKSKQDKVCEYDIRFNFSLDFDPKAHRDDRHNLDVVRNNIHHEERNRVIPITSSQIYGHKRYNLEGPCLISHKRTRVMAEVLRRFRVNVKPHKKLPENTAYPVL
ncbi:hypothetical protein O3M35_002347 [Rhynocoris fuscipes]|uniref:Uncharacterized protein n=1 Tax=Rhynocoris fuscipes TaxID=488301 RepID=A0AAW1CSP9_9HEMI